MNEFAEVANGGTNQSVVTELPNAAWLNQNSFDNSGYINPNTTAV